MIKIIQKDLGLIKTAFKNMEKFRLVSVHTKVNVLPRWRLDVRDQKLLI